MPQHPSTRGTNAYRRLIDRPYAERQLIVVTDDRVAAAEQEAAEEPEPGVDGNSWSSRGRHALNNLGRITEAATDVLQRLHRFRDEGVNVLTVGRSEAEGLRFTPGHPLDGVVYVGHPVVPWIYYPTALFHRLTFEHKLAEALRLLMALGASEMAVEHEQGWSSDLSTPIKIPLGLTHMRFDASGKESHQATAPR